jgi:hypothetical protein
MSRDELLKLINESEITPTKKAQVDLQLGPADANSNPWLKDPQWWLKTYGPKPTSPGIIALDVLIVLLCCIALLTIISTWVWVFGK